ncbi:MAG: hypothetical protein JWP25_2416 [Bradyrhizobium sp.]|jgi:hypothetical protein|nr:hypothetical protein [Bradyrhizobium sp.]
MEQPALIHTCECGTKYKLLMVRTGFPTTGDAVCGKCHAVMDSWRDTTIFWAYSPMETCRPLLKRG